MGKHYDQLDLDERIEGRRPVVAKSTRETKWAFGLSDEAGKPVLVTHVRPSESLSRRGAGPAGCHAANANGAPLIGRYCTEMT